MAQRPLLGTWELPYGGKHVEELGKVTYVGTGCATSTDFLKDFWRRFRDSCFLPPPPTPHFTPVYMSLIQNSILQGHSPVAVGECFPFPQHGTRRHTAERPWPIGSSPQTQLSHVFLTGDIMPFDLLNPFKPLSVPCWYGECRRSCKCQSTAVDGVLIIGILHRSM